MTPAPHHRHWPRGLPHTLHLPQTTLSHNLAVAAARFPDKPAIHFYGAVLSYAELERQVDRMAGYLQQRLGVRAGDRVLLLSQNCPQFIIATYAVLRAGAVVVPVNVMSTPQDLAHNLNDSGATLAFAAQELLPRLTPCIGETPLASVIVFAYGDVSPDLDSPGTPTAPDWVRAPSQPVDGPALVAWEAAMTAGLSPGPLPADSSALCTLPYTSGTTGRPKGCRHSHATLMASNTASALWRGMTSEAVMLAVAPLFHMLGLQNGMHLPISLGATIVMLPRWDAAAAAALIERHRVSVWAAPPAMLVDFFAHPDAARRDLSSLALVSGGGAALPEAVHGLLKERFGIDLNEAYGLTETASVILANPVARGKRQCLGVPVFSVEAIVVEPTTLSRLPTGEVGELLLRGPQVFLGYWQDAAADAAAFVEVDDRRWFRTGDLVSVDNEGYCFMRDRLKRMINVSGYKVWPAEVESQLYGHPAIHEACVVAVADAQRGESVKALVVLKPAFVGQVEASDFIAWCRDHMAAYKAPRWVQIVEALPKSSTGKILWRELQEAERASAVPHTTSHSALP